MENTFIASPTFSAALKEEVRRVLAHLNKCAYCIAKGAPSQVLEDLRIQAAVDLARTIWTNDQGVSPEMFAIIKTHFSDAEISELCAFICFISASQKFGATLNLHPQCSF